MAAKGKEAPVAVDFDSPDYDAQFEDGTRLQDSLEAAVSASSTDILAQNARCLVLQQAVEATISSALTTIDMLFMARDDAAVTSISLVNGSWDPEPEPEPCAVDNWLRAAIPETQQPKQSYMLAEFLKGPTASPPGRMASMRRSESKARTSQTQAVASGGSSPPRGARSSSPQVAGRGSPAAGPASRRKQLTPEQAAAERRLREELEVRKAQLAVLADMAAKDVEARARIGTITKELKGKEYSYDHKGQVVALAQVPGDGAIQHGGPSFAVHLPEDAAAPKGGNRRGAGSPVRKDGGKAPASHGSKERKLTNDFRETVPRTQPSTLQVMAPSGGVTLRGGGASKMGPARAKQGLGMSKEELDKYAASVAAAQQRAPAAARGTGTLASSRQHSPSTAARGSTPRLDPLPSTTSRPTAGAAASTTAAAAAAAPAQLEPLVGMYTRGSLDATAGPGSLRFSEGMLAQLPNSPSRLAGGTVKGQPEVQAKPLTPDPNPALVGAADWGRSAGVTGGNHPALETVKPSAKAREMEVGRAVRLPRDRASQATTSPPISPAKLQPHVPVPTFVHG